MVPWLQYQYHRQTMGQKVKSPALHPWLHLQGINRTTNIFPWKSLNWFPWVSPSVSLGFARRRHWSPPGLEWGVGRNPQSLNESVGDSMGISNGEIQRMELKSEDGDRMGYDSTWWSIRNGRINKEKWICLKSWYDGHKERVMGYVTNNNGNAWMFPLIQVYHHWCSSIFHGKPVATSRRHRFWGSHPSGQKTSMSEARSDFGEPQCIDLFCAILPLIWVSIDLAPLRFSHDRRHSHSGWVINCATETTGICPRLGDV